MHIRPFQLRDLSSVVDVFIETVPHDALGLFMRPSPHKHPTSHRHGCVNYIRSMLTATGSQSFVMVADSNDSPAYISDRNVIAWTIFQRLGSSPTATAWQTSNPASSPLERLSSSLATKYRDIFPSTDPATDTRNVAKIQHIFSTPWSPSVFAEAWLVDALYVSPTWQRRGIGGQLLNWVKAQAARERVPVVVKGSALGGPAYRKHGFRSIGFDRFGRFFDEVEFGGERHQLWMWEPVGMEGVWYERAKGWWEGVVGEAVARGEHDGLSEER